MFRYLHHKEIDKEKWDDCIRQSPQSLLYALSFYLDIVAPNWAALVEEGVDNYLTVMPLIAQTKYGFTFLHQPLFCQQLGVFSSKQTLSPTELQSLFSQIFNQYSYTSHYHFNTHNLFLVNDLDLKKVQISTAHTHLLPLQNSYEQIYKNYSLDRKKNLKRAQKANLTILESENIELLITMFEQDIAHKIKGGVAKNAYSLLRELYTALNQKKLCKLLYTQNLKGEINAGSLFAFHQNQIIYLFNAAFTHARKENGRMFLIDYVLKKYSNSDKVFDFESPEIEAIAYFYQSFGAEAVPYPILHYNHLPTWVNALWKIKKHFSATFYLNICL